MSFEVEQIFRVKPESEIVITRREMEVLTLIA
jgi:hypothetical protein